MNALSPALSSASSSSACPAMLQGIAPLLERYDAFIIDLWGVIHDGSALYEGSDALLRAMVAAGKQVLLLSNAPRQNALAVATLQRLGIDDACYHHILTSGQAAHDMLAESADWSPHYYYLGPGKDEQIIDDLAHYHRTDEIGKAGWVLCTGFEYDYQPEAEIEPLLARLLAARLPLLCANPDIEVIKQDGTRLLCAGWVAARYAALGGAVHYVGKPHALVYQESLKRLGSPPRVLAMGDNPATVILGANRAQLDALLILGGILKTAEGTLPDTEAVLALCRSQGAKPTYLAAAFRL